MALLHDDSQLPLDRLRELRTQLVEQLAEYETLLQDGPNIGAERAARGLTARTLVRDASRWAHAGTPREDRDGLIAEINLLYDIELVAAEYHKLFARDPTPERPAGRI